MMCNQNKNGTGLIDVSQGFARCAQIWLAAKIGGAVAIQKIWVKWSIVSLSPVGTSILLVLKATYKYPLEIRELLWDVKIDYGIFEKNKEHKTGT